MADPSPPELSTLSLDSLLGPPPPRTSPPNAPSPQPSTTPTADSLLPPTDDSPSSTPLPPHRSHSPSTNRKRSAPFQFGSRHLLPTDDPFAFNAWDHVAPTPAHLAWAASQYALQRAHPTAPFDVARFNRAPAKWWDKFYANHTSNFFKDRKWLRQEFPILSEVTDEGAGPKLVLEVGAGAGNTCFPILRANANAGLRIVACDYSRTAVELVRGNAEFDARWIRAEVWDVTSEALPEGVDEGSVDVVLMIFIFSALSPEQWDQAVGNVWRCLRPGGEVCFRDYGRGDLAQVRFKKGRLLGENFYVRGDGTRVYFFEEQELRDIWGGTKPAEISDRQDAERREDSGGSVRADGQEVEDGKELPSSAEKARDQVEDWVAGTKEVQGSPRFEIVSLGVDRRMLVNRQRQLQMYRCWMQGRFKKPETQEISSTTSDVKVRHTPY